MRKSTGAAKPLEFIAPQLPTLVEEPPDGANWIHEVKYDGYRTQLHVTWRRMGQAWPDGEREALERRREAETRDPARYPVVSMRIDPSWTVFKSIEDDHHERCVDLFERPDGTFGFDEFRRDFEDQGRWTPTQYYSGRSFGSRDAAWDAAKLAVIWLA